MSTEGALPAARLQGINLPGRLVVGGPPGRDAPAAGERDLARLASWRFNHVRVPVDAGLLGEGDGWETLDRTVALCDQYGLACVLALRVPDHAALFAGLDGWRPVAEWWRAVALRYRDRPAEVLFDLLDTPDVPDDVSEETLRALGAPRLSLAAARRPPAPGAAAGRAWTALATRLTQFVRDVDARRILIVEAHRRASPGAFATLRPTRDTRTIYSFHAFAPEAFTLRGEGTYPGDVAGERWDRARIEETFGPALEFRRVYDAPLYAGAFGATAAAGRQPRLTWVRSLVALCRAHGIGWAYWSYDDPALGLFAGPSPAGTGDVDYDLLGILRSEA